MEKHQTCIFFKNATQQEGWSTWSLDHLLYIRSENVYLLKHKVFISAERFIPRSGNFYEICSSGDTQLLSSAVQSLCWGYKQSETIVEVMKLSCIQTCHREETTFKSHSNPGFWLNSHSNTIHETTALTSLYVS